MRVMPDDIFQPEPFFIEFSGGYLHGDFLQKADSVDAPPAVLFLHGFDTTEDRTEFSLLRQVLLNYHGVPSCAFDFSGQGGTSGEWAKDSSAYRLGQAEDVVDSCFDCQPFSIVAAGASAYTALKLATLAPVRNLILIAPAIDTDSDLDQAIQGFQGKVCLVTAAYDQEAAFQLIAKFKKNPTISSDSLVLDISHPVCPHGLMKFITNDIPSLVNVARTVADMCVVSDGVCINE